MSVQEILQKEVFTVDDIKALCGLKKDRAYKLIREIRDYSDRLRISGKIHRKDYEDYINRFDKAN